MIDIEVGVGGFSLDDFCELFLALLVLPAIKEMSDIGKIVLLYHLYIMMLKITDFQQKNSVNSASEC